MFYINGFVSTSFKNYWNFLNFEFVFEFLAENRTSWPKTENFGRKPKNIQTACILIEVQCIKYQWIWFDKLNELMESFFFQISESFFELVTIF